MVIGGRRDQQEVAMLEGLGSIDWEALGSRPPGDPWNVPENIRRLLSDRPEVRKDALERLIDGESHDTIVRATPQMLPFLFALLGSEYAPDKALIVEKLEYVLEEVALMQAPSMVVMRRYVAIYDSFKDHLRLILKLLEDPDEPLRLASLDLLRHMHDDSEAITSVLLDRLQDAPSEVEATRTLQTLDRLWQPATARQNRPQPTLLPLLQNLIDGHASPRVRVAAARLATFFPGELEWRNVPLLETVSALLARDFFARTALFQYEDLYQNHSRALLADILRLPNRQNVLFALLRDPAISAEQAHLAGSALIADAFLNSDVWERGSYDYSYSRREQGFFYRRHEDRDRRILDHTRPILAQLVEIEVFWALPTNLLSFFYGLPDDRAELYALLEAQ
jgi:hypothetical protein